MSVKTTVDTVTDDLIRLRYLFVNLYLQGSSDQWVLIDAGVQGCADDIVKVAEDRFGEGTEPFALS